MITLLFFAAALQTAAAAPPAVPPPATQALSDKVAALVGQGKCADAKTAATDGGDQSLAQQVDELCGVKPAAGGGKGGGGRGHGGGGRGGGSRGGSGG